MSIHMHYFSLCTTEFSFHGNPFLPLYNYLCWQYEHHTFCTLIGHVVPDVTFCSIVAPTVTFILSTSSTWTRWWIWRRELYTIILGGTPVVASNNICSLRYRSLPLHTSTVLYCSPVHSPCPVCDKSHVVFCPVVSQLLIVFRQYLFMVVLCCWCHPFDTTLY